MNIKIMMALALIAFATMVATTTTVEAATIPSVPHGQPDINVPHGQFVNVPHGQFVP